MYLKKYKKREVQGQKGKVRGDTEEQGNRGTEEQGSRD